MNAKGGSGATTVAVNLALALQSIHHSTALVDLAPLGHCALHLNVKPAFTVSDAITNLHRLDSSLLDSFMSRHDRGLKYWPAQRLRSAIEPTASDFARLFDTMVGQFHYIVVDASSRLDTATRLVSNLSEKILLIAHADVASLWGAGRVAQYLGESGSRDRFSLCSTVIAKWLALTKPRPKLPLVRRCFGGFRISTSQSRPRSIAASRYAAGEYRNCAVYFRAGGIPNQGRSEVKRSAWSLFKTV